MFYQSGVLSGWERLRLVSSYYELVARYLSNGYQGHLVTFKFTLLHGNGAAKLRQVQRALEHFFGIFITRVVRKPNSPNWIDKCPVFIGCPDFPVAKHEKQPLSEVLINDGLHAHGILLVPEKSRLEKLNKSVEGHFEKGGYMYLSKVKDLASIHSVPIVSNPDRVVDYVLKGLKTRKVECDDIIILPKAALEISAAKVFERF
jgi:hypothetical protein